MYRTCEGKRTEKKGGQTRPLNPLKLDVREKQAKGSEDSGQKERRTGECSELRKPKEKKVPEAGADGQWEDNMGEEVSPVGFPHK